MGPLWLLSTLALCYIPYATVRHYYRCFRSPPSPWGLPFVGILLQDLIRGAFSKRPEDKIPYLAKNSEGEKYATRKNVGFWSFQIGTQRVIYLHSLDAIEEATITMGNLFSGRPNSHFYSSLFHNLGIVYSDGDKWQAQRRFCLRVLRNFGWGKSLMEANIQQEATFLCEAMNAEGAGETPMNPKNIIGCAVSNVICQLVFGQRYRYDNPEMEAQRKDIGTFLHYEGLLPLMSIYFPELAQLGLFSLLRSTSIRAAAAERIMERLLEKWTEIQARVATDQNAPSTCVMEAFVQEQAAVTQRQMAGNPQAGDESFSTEGCINTCRDLFGAGTDTTTVFLLWSLLYLGAYPEVQRKLQMEIDSVIALKEVDEVVSYTWRSATPYLCAVMDEVHRHATIAPTSVERRVVNTTQFRGYTLEPSDLIIVNLYGVHHDTKLWGSDAHIFRPERFLKDPQSSLEMCEYLPSKFLNQFGFGRRQCLGEVLARNEGFIFLFEIVRKFNIDLAPETVGNLEKILFGKGGFIRTPGDFELVLSHRQTDSF